MLLKIKFTDPRDANRDSQDVANALDAFDLPAEVTDVRATIFQAAVVCDYEGQHKLAAELRGLVK